MSNGNLEQDRAKLASILSNLYTEGGHSYRSIATLAGLSHTTVADAILNRKTPSWKPLQKMGAVLGADERVLRDLWLQIQEGQRSPAFIDIYRERVRQAYGRMPTVDGFGPSVDSMDSYEPPRVQIVGERHPRGDLLEKLTEHKLMAIVGTAASGKSTLLKYFMWSCSVREDLAQAAFLIHLREFSPARISVVEHIEQSIEAFLQLRVPNSWIREQLAKSYCLVLFDGLDELPSAERVQVATMIRMFSREFPLVGVVVTSRIIGFDYSGLGLERYTIAKILEYDEGQAYRHACNWFVAQGTKNPVEARNMAEQLMKASREVSSTGERNTMILNPLMLSMLCKYFLIEGRLPQPQDDENATFVRLLVKESWDQARGIAKPQSGPEVVSVLAYIASAMRRLGEVSVTKTRLRGLIADYLLKNSEVNRPAALVMAEDIVQNVSERTGVLTADSHSSRSENLQFRYLWLMDYLADEYESSTA